MIGAKQDEKDGHDQKNRHPGVGYLLHAKGVTGLLFEFARQNDNQPLTGNHGQAIKSIANAYKESLLFGFQGMHIKAVGCNIVGGRTESRQPEKSHAGLNPKGGGQTESHASEKGSDQQLHQHYPPAFAFDDIYKRTPKKFNGPGQVEPGSVKSDVGIGHAKALVEYYRNGHYGNIRQTFAKIQTGNPAPGRDSLFRSHTIALFAC